MNQKTVKLLRRHAAKIFGRKGYEDLRVGMYRNAKRVWNNTPRKQRARLRRAVTRDLLKAPEELRKVT